MTALAILVKFTIPEGSMDTFMEAAHHDAKHSISCLTTNRTQCIFLRFPMIKRLSIHIAHSRIIRSTTRLPRRLASPGNASTLLC